MRPVITHVPNAQSKSGISAFDSEHSTIRSEAEEAHSPISIYARSRISLMHLLGSAHEIGSDLLGRKRRKKIPEMFFRCYCAHHHRSPRTRFFRIIGIDRAVARDADAAIIVECHVMQHRSERSSDERSRLPGEDHAIHRGLVRNRVGARDTVGLGTDPTRARVRSPSAWACPRTTAGRRRRHDVLRADRALPASTV
jgi:hypothetical protein